MKNRLLVIFTLFTISLLAIQPLFAGSLVAYWTFDEGTGDVVVDHSGNGNDGQVNGAEWVDGKFEKAMQFNGVDNFVLVPNDDSYSFGKGESFSISLWVNYEPKGDYQGIFQKWTGAGGYPFKIEVEPSNQLYFAVYDGSNFPKAFIGDVSGDWHHCCFIKDADSSKLYAYLDGVLVEEADDTTGDVGNDADLYIGARQPGNTITYKGILDEIAIYNRVLTEDEIKQAAGGNLPEVNSAVTPVDKLATTWGDVKEYY